MQEKGLYADAVAPGPRCRRYEVDIVVTEEDGHLWVEALWSGQLVVIEARRSDTDEMVVRIRQQLPRRPGRDLKSEGGLAWRRGPGEGIVADLLGHREDDVTLFTPPSD